MEKLNKLLEEYPNWKWDLDSLKFLRPFIQWLVENNKIDLLKLDNRIALSEFNKVERVLMALSIQDNSIEFLCSILK
jgi:hypothetical protein